MDQRVALGDRIYGCDECQDVCPPNRLELRRSAPGGSGQPVPLGDPKRSWVQLLEMLASTDEELLERHGRWYIPKRQARYLRRNAIIVLGNTGSGSDNQVRAALGEALRSDDAVIRSSAVWSARRLGCDDLLMAVENDQDPMVQEEMSAEVPPKREER